jgi:Ca-activated chloride channel family protein
MKKRFSIFAILILAAILMAYTESRTITGKVTDQSGRPLAGVTIVFKGEAKGTISDNNGNYRITTVHQSKVLIFAFPGYTQVEEKTGDRSIINVMMKEEAVALNEMVVTAYGVKRERESKSYDRAAPMIAGLSSQRSFQRYNNNFNTEGYAAVNENGYKNVRSSPLSTFSIDVVY